MVNQYKKNQDVVEAIQYTGLNTRDIEDFLNELIYERVYAVYRPNGSLPSDRSFVYKGQNVMYGYYLVKEKGSILVLNESQFKEIYQPV